MLEIRAFRRVVAKPTAQSGVGAPLLSQASIVRFSRRTPRGHQPFHEESLPGVVRLVLMDRGRA
jgi:hypothetical protein